MLTNKTVRLNSRGQITIPMKIRRQLQLQNGDEIRLILEGKKIIVSPVEYNIESAFGLCKADISVSLEDMERAIRERAGK